MYFLIDYENVKSNGMKGSEHLVSEDTVELFFSNATPTMSNGVFEDIKESGCEFKICKLQTQRKNALDFYITTRLGELIGKGYQEPIAIISNDNDFKSVQDYWRECSDSSKRILLTGTITDGIIAANQSTDRTRKLRDHEKMVSIEVEFAKYEENNRIHQMLMAQFSDTEYANRLAEIEKIYKDRNDKKILYLNSLKCFGKEDGTQIYNQMKQIIV